MSKQPCAYCGNNPINHYAYKWTDNMTVIFTPFTDYILRGRIGAACYKMIDATLWGMAKILELFGILKYTGNLSQTPIARARVLWEEAEKRNIKMEGALLHGRYSDLYQARINGKQVRFNGLPRPKRAENGHIFTLDDKSALKNKLLTVGVPFPPGACCTDLSVAIKKFQTLNKPVIIKPRLGSRGRHTTTHIYTDKHLKQAFQIAKQLCRWIIIEEQLVGNVFRGTVINGKLVGVLAGSAPKIIGDGTLTIKKLIAQKNLDKTPSIKDIQINQSMLELLNRQNLSLDSILPAGQIIEVSEKIGVDYGGDSCEVTDETHPDIKMCLEKAAAAMNDPLLGFDFIIPDITQTPSGQRWGIIECNGLPFINLHHHPRTGTPNNIAKHVWDMIETDTK